MKKTALILSTTALALGLLAPRAHADWNEVRGDRRELRGDYAELNKDRRQYYDAWRSGDRRGMENERREIYGDMNEIRRDRQELYGDIGEAHRGSSYGRLGWGYGHDWNRYDQHGRFDDPRYDHYDRYDGRPESYGWYRPWWPWSR